MKNKQVKKINSKGKQWQVQQFIGEWAARLNRLPDADEIRRNPLKSAPLNLTEMVF